MARQIIFHANYFFDFYKDLDFKVKAKIQYVLELIKQVENVPDKFLSPLIGYDRITSYNVCYTKLLRDGSMIRLTIAKYYTPSGRCIQKQYEDGDYANEIQTRYLHGEMSNKDSVHFENGEAYKTRLLGRTVYGGGGIMPDVFIPVDTIVFTNYYRDLLATGALNKTVLTYVDGNRKALQAKYPDFKSFSSGFSVDNQFFDELIKEGEAEKVKLNEKQLEISRPLISEQIKALVARDLFTASEYYQVINELSDAYIKAVQIIDVITSYSIHYTKLYDREPPML